MKFNNRFRSNNFFQSFSNIKLYILRIKIFLVFDHATGLNYYSVDGSTVSKIKINF